MSSLLESIATYRLDMGLWAHFGHLFFHLSTPPPTFRPPTPMPTLKITTDSTTNLDITVRGGQIVVTTVDPEPPQQTGGQTGSPQQGSSQTEPPHQAGGQPPTILTQLLQCRSHNVNGGNVEPHRTQFRGSVNAGTPHRARSEAAMHPSSGSRFQPPQRIGPQRTGAATSTTSATPWPWTAKRHGTAKPHGEGASNDTKRVKTEDVPRYRFSRAVEERGREDAVARVLEGMAAAGEEVDLTWESGLESSSSGSGDEEGEGEGKGGQQ
ncbi:hypothetical protein HDU96_002472 [Phlyctochytrium bullatum]|nr:hypothetical protein HDU96_002472 [Phlyctochytrium bullatum]